MKLPEFHGYALFNWVHTTLNVPSAYKDLSARSKVSAGMTDPADMIVQNAAITTLDLA